MLHYPGVLITGPLGSGKTSVAIEIGHILAEAEEAVAVIDLDWLVWIHVPEEQPAITELIAENLAAVWANYERAGIRKLVMARALKDVHEIDRIRRAVPHVTIQVVRLTAPPSTLERRLQSRDMGAEREENLREATTLLSELADEGLGSEDFVVANDDRPIRDVAQEILMYLDWFGP